MNLQAAYKNKKVLLTGHTGFKGSWLLTWLHALGANVNGYALAPEGPDSLYHHIEGDTLCTSVIADIRDRERLRQEVQAFAPDFVFHLAAQPLVRLSYQQPVETFEVNVMGTAHLLDALRGLDKPCVAVVITTDKVYFNREEEYHYKEDDPLGGYDPYSASKACAELVVDSYRNSFFPTGKYAQHQLSLSSARAGNVIGGGDWSKDRIVPDIVRALSAGQPVAVRNPAAVRPWQHVLDPLYGYLLLGACQQQDPVRFAQAYNFGPRIEDRLPVQGLVEQAVTAWGGGDYERANVQDGLHEAGLLQLDSRKAGRELNWTPSFTTEEAISHTIGWYRTYLKEGCNARQLIEQDIQKLTTI